MDHVVSHITAEISTNGTRSSLKRLCGTHHLTSNGNNVVSFPHHGNNSRRAHETSEARIETLALVLSIVLLKKRHRRNEHLQTNKLESLLLEASNNLANTTALDSVGLDSNKSSLLQNKDLDIQNTRGIATIFMVMQRSRKSGNICNLATSLDSITFLCSMPKKFDTSRIYELPILRHNTAAVKLIFANATDSELSDEFLTKATTHNTLLAKLSGF